MIFRCAYIDSCDCNDSPSGVLNNGVVTWLYRKLHVRHRHSSGVIAVQLLPVYINQGMSVKVHFLDFPGLVIFIANIIVINFDN